MEVPKNYWTKFFQTLRDDKNGWIICMVGIVVNAVRSGITYTFGLYIAELRKIYGSSMTELMWIPLIASSITCLFAPLPTFLINLDQNKGYAIVSMAGTLLQSGACLVSSFVTQVPFLLLSFSLAYGIGSCMVMISSSLILDKCFPAAHKYHEFATSIINCSIPTGLVVFASIYAWLIETYSWRWSLRVAAAITFVIGFIGSLLLLLERPDYAENKIEEPRKANLFYYCLEAFRRPERICWIIGMSLSYTCQIVVVNILSHYLEEKGLSPVTSSFSLGTFGFAQLIGFCIIPFFGSSLRGNLSILNIISSLFYAILFLIWPISKPSYELVLAYSAVFGICGSSSFTFIFPATGEVMEMEMGASWTIINIGVGVACLLGPLMSGLIYDYTNSYDTVLYTLSLLCFINFLLFTAIPLIKLCRRKRYEIL